MKKNSELPPEKFLQTVQQWLAEQGEVVILLENRIEPPQAHLYSNYEQLFNDLKKESGYDTVYAIRDFHFPMRAVFDDAFLVKAMKMLTGETEYALMKEDGAGNFHARYNGGPERPDDFLDDLDFYQGKHCVFGEFPRHQYTDDPQKQVETNLMLLRKMKQKEQGWFSRWVKKLTTPIHMPKLLLLLMLSLPLKATSQSSSIRLPELESLALEPDRQLLIPLSLFYGADRNLKFGFEDKYYSETDSLRSYLMEKLKPKNELYRMRVAVALLADQDVKMQDIELIQEELKRFKLLKVFFAGTPKGNSQNLQNWNWGFYYSLPSVDEENIHLFYNARKLKRKAQEPLVLILDQEDEARRKRENPNYGKGIPQEPPPPPPPPPAPELPRRYDPATMDGNIGLQVVIIEVSGTNQYLINGKSIAETELKTAVGAFLDEAECLFVLRTDPESTYGKYVKTLDVILYKLADLQNQAALNQHGKSFKELPPASKRKIKAQFRLLLINEPIYYRKE